VRRQAAFEIQDLATVLDAARQVKPLTGVAIVQLQRLFHVLLSSCYA
jgi:hypothetical protein